MKQFLVAWGLLALLLVGYAAPVQAQGRTRCFAETQQCVSGVILDYWERNGGLPVFGYPTTALREEPVYDEYGSFTWSGPLQWFERDRLEDHTTEGKGVLAGRLGAQQLRNLTVSLVIPPPQPVSGAGRGCRYFPETKHSACPPFLDYWQNRGGLARFGYPLTEPFTQTIGAWTGTVQYFERRRMEIHTELPGQPVLLGLLGRELQSAVPSNPCATEVIPELRATFRPALGPNFRAQMGCPQEALRDLPAAEQYFERGVMVWVAVPTANGVEPRIYIVRSSPLPVTYQIERDTWAEGQPETAGLTPPPGLSEPRRGFGKLWRELPGVRAALGWATQPERSDRAVFQPFDASPGLLWLQQADFVYIFGPDGQMTAHPRDW